MAGSCHALYPFSRFLYSAATSRSPPQVLLLLLAGRPTQTPLPPILGTALAAFSTALAQINKNDYVQF